MKHYGTLCVVGSLALAMVAPPSRHLPLPPEQMVELMGSGAIEPRSSQRAQGGVMGVAHAIVRFSDLEANVEVKWKEAPRGDADGWNNSPRKELAAYRVQRWFLDPDDDVVPPAAMRCIPLEPYRRLFPDAEPTIEGTSCALGLMSAWLQDVEVPEPLYDATRFENDRAYAVRLANLNLLLYIIEHRDARKGNILAAKASMPPRFFSVDNGIAFGGLVFNYFMPHWDRIRVPALPREAIARLRKVAADDLQALSVIAELRADAAGVLRLVPPGPVEEPTKGARVGPGWIQLGLTSAEIEGVRQRLRDLLAAVDVARQPVF